MIRFLMIIGMIVAIFWVIKQLFRFFLLRWLRNLQVSAQSPFTPTNVSGLTEKLVQCENCRTFIPENKAIIYRQRFYCSQEHAKL